MRSKEYFFFCLVMYDLQDLVGYFWDIRIGMACDTNIDDQIWFLIFCNISTQGMGGL